MWSPQVWYLLTSVHLACDLFKSRAFWLWDLLKSASLFLSCVKTMYVRVFIRNLKKGLNMCTRLEGTTMDFVTPVAAWQETKHDIISTRWACVYIQNKWISLPNLLSTQSFFSFHINHLHNLKKTLKMWPLWCWAYYVSQKQRTLV